MPLYETTLSVRLPNLETVPIDVGSSYPFPRLVPILGSQEVDLRAIVLENDHLRVAVLPELGGRLIMPFAETPAFSMEAGGRRGVRLSGGVEFTLDGAERHDAMGPVDVAVNDDEESASVLVGGLAPPGIMWYVRYQLSASRASVQVDVRVANRTFQSLPFLGGFLGDEIAVVAERGVLVGGFRHGPEGVLGPRQVDSWSCECVPLEAGGEAWMVGGILIQSKPGTVFLTALEASQQAKLVLRREGGDMEAPFDAPPGARITYTLPEGVFEAALVRDGEILERWQPGAPEKSTWDPESPATWRRALADSDRKGAAYVLQAERHLRRGEFDATEEALNDALSVNAEDALIWWLKAALQRRKGEAADQELVNAHYLSPFEPLLRAEAFLSMPARTKEPSPLVASLMEDPDRAVEVACHLHRVGFNDDLATWVDECLRHREVPMLRYLLADALLASSRMHTEAAAQVAAVAKAPINPPYPWRREERGVLDRLSKAFPEDGRVAELGRMITDRT